MQKSVTQIIYLWPLPDAHALAALESNLHEQIESTELAKNQALVSNLCLITSLGTNIGVLAAWESNLHEQIESTELAKTRHECPIFV